MQHIIPQMISLISWSAIILFTADMSVDADDLEDENSPDEDKIEKYDTLNRPDVTVDDVTIIFDGEDIYAINE